MIALTIDFTSAYIGFIVGVLVMYVIAMLID